MNSHVPVPTIRRLPSYLRLLREAAANRMEFISGTYIANDLKLEPIQVRKDLAITGVVGKPRMGFAVIELIQAIEELLGWTNASDAFLVGVGSLGIALMGYDGFKEYGLKVVAGFDVDPEKIGKQFHGKKVFDLNKFAELAKRMGICTSILTVPAQYAQDVTDILVAAGIKGIWNFTPIKLQVPDDVIVEKVDLAASLAVLSSKLQARQHNKMRE